MLNVNITLRTKSLSESISATTDVGTLKKRRLKISGDVQPSWAYLIRLVLATGIWQWLSLMGAAQSVVANRGCGTH